jgi:hypothetical protein
MGSGKVLSASNAAGCVVQCDDGWSLRCSDLIVGMQPTRSVLPHHASCVVIVCVNGDTYVVDESHTVLHVSAGAPGKGCVKLLGTPCSDRPTAQSKPLVCWKTCSSI